MNTIFLRLASDGATGNRPGAFSLGTSPASVNPRHLAFEECSWGGRAPEAHIVVHVRRVVVVPVGDADVVPIVVPTAAPQHLIGLSPRIQSSVKTLHKRHISAMIRGYLKFFFLIGVEALAGF